MGALRRLNEVGILSQIDAISSVSGGSILAAHLAERVKPWPTRGAVFADWHFKVEAPFHKLVKTNIRTWPILNRLLPWNWLKRSTGVETLESQYERHLTRLKLPELPDRPRFLINATDLPFAVNWIFDSQSLDGVKGRAGDYQAGYLRPLPDWPVARAVAASSCFPPIFNPLPVPLKPAEVRGGKYAKPDRDKITASMRLSDGGVYDNLGLEPVWKNYEILLVSDGGGTFEPDAAKGLFWTLSRYVSVVDSQVRALRKRWLMSNLIDRQIFGAYWGIGSTAGHYTPGADGYSESLVDEIISEVRTDLDAFSDAEIAVLENHGYTLADAAIRRHLVTLSEMALSTSLVLTMRPRQLPFPLWLEERAVRESLKGSHKIHLMGRR